MNIVKNYLSSLGELKGERIKLCDYFSDPDSQLALAKHYLEFDEKSFSFFFPGTSLRNAEDILIYQKIFEQDKNYKSFVIKNLENNPIGQFTMEYWKPLGINLGYIIAKPYWGKGFALDSVKIVMKNLYENKITAPILIGAEPENAKSLRVVEKLIKELQNESKPKYKIEQKTIKFEATYKTDEENPDFVVCSISSAGEGLREKDCKFLKRLVNSEILEKAYFTLEDTLVVITPIYEN